MSKQGKPRNERFYQDDFDHLRFRKWHLSRSQANFRKEGWAITVEEWFKMWPLELWNQRGKARHNLCMVRKDATQPWSVANCEIITRLEQLQRSADERKQRNKRFRKWR